MKKYRYFFILLLSLIFLVIVLVLRSERLRDQDVFANYECYSAVLRGQLPYKDIPLEYPPLALIPMLFPALLTFGKAVAFGTYVTLFAIQNVLYSMLMMWVLVAIVARGQPEREIPPVLSLYTQLAITLSPLIFIRYDIFPALLSALGLYAMIRGRPMLAGALTGAGMAAKLYPVVFIPVFVVAYFVSRDRKSLFAFGFGLAAALVLIVPPFAWISGGKMWTALQFLQVRGLQIESVAAGIISLLKVLGVTQASSVHEYHAWHLETPLSAGALTVLPILLISAFVVASFCCAFRFWEEYHLKGRVSVQSMVAYSAIFLLILLVFSKVFSSQFLLWLLPFGVLLKRKQTLLLLATSLLTLIIYPLLYLSLIALEPLPVLMLNLRNILVILLLVWLLIEHRPSFRLPIQIPG